METATGPVPDTHWGQTTTPPCESLERSGSGAEQLSDITPRSHYRLRRSQNPPVDMVYPTRCSSNGLHRQLGRLNNRKVIIG